MHGTETNGLFAIISRVLCAGKTIDDFGLFHCEGTIMTKRTSVVLSETGIYRLMPAIILGITFSQLPG
jgi:hypothetical protein